MATVKRVFCVVPGCTNMVTVTGRMCAEHQLEAKRAEIEAQCEEDARIRKELNIPDTWGCLDPDCEICS